MKYDMRPMIKKLEPWLKAHDIEVLSSKRQLDNGSAAFYGNSIKTAFSITAPNLFVYCYRRAPLPGLTDDNVMQRYSSPVSNRHLPISKIEAIVKKNGLDPDKDIITTPGGNNIILSKMDDKWTDIISDIIKETVIQWESNTPFKNDADHAEKLKKFADNRDRGNGEIEQVKNTLAYVNRLFGGHVKRLNLNKQKTKIQSLTFDKENAIFPFYPDELSSYDEKTMFDLSKVNIGPRILIKDGKLDLISSNLISSNACPTIFNAVIDFDKTAVSRCNEIYKKFGGVNLLLSSSHKTDWQKLKN